MDAEETVRRYDEILQLTREQREAIEGGDLERLLTLLARREMLLASLPAEQDTDRQRGRREQIAELDSANEASLCRWREQVVAELRALQRGQIGLGGYRARTLVENSFIDRIS